MTAAARCTALLLLMAAFYPTAAIAQEASAYKGMPLAEVLQLLQARGLRIAFSSAIVTPDMRVLTEPRARSARRQLDELLAPHDLEVRDGPGGTLQIVRSAAPKRVKPSARGTVEGSVLDAWTGSPLPDATVVVHGHAVQARTDAAGQFEIAQLTIGTRVVTASAVGYIPVRREVAVGEATAATVRLRLLPEARRHQEFVSVHDSAPDRRNPGVASEWTVDAGDFARLQGSVAEDPLRAVHSLPGVTPVDDFRSDFAVRGSPFRHVAVVLDGMSTRWLQHTAFGRAAAGSVMMLSGLAMEKATLRTGPYPRRHGDRLGAELDLTLREGSRDHFAMRGVVGGAHAVVAAEGPLGSRRPTGSAPGSWILSARQSYLEWPPERAASSRTPFGFSDALAKVVFDATPTQQLSMTAIGGLTSLEEEEDLAPTGPVEGTNQAAAFSVSWRSRFGSRLAITQRASVITQRFRNTGRGTPEADRGANRSVAYWGELSQAVAGALLEAGTHIERIEIARRPQASSSGRIDGSSWLRSGFVHVSWPAARSFTISPGARATWSPLLRRPVVSRWLLAEWSLHRGWTLFGSTGTSRQLPELEYVLGRTGSPELRPERAAHVEAALEQRTAGGFRWQATAFHRREADIIQSPHTHPRLVANALLFPVAGHRYANALRGRSRGVELLVSRTSPLGLSALATYAYGRTRHQDVSRGNVFWADFDQRHTFSLYARYRFSSSTSVGTTFRAGSNFPIAGYFDTSEGRLVVGDARNEVRLPPYARLDVRVERRLRSFGRPLTLFVEALNALNRANAGLAEGTIDSTTGEAIGFTDTLLRRRITAGAVFEF